MNQKIIVTGAGGFIGRYLVRELLKRGDEVYSVVRKDIFDTFDSLDRKKLFVIESDLENLNSKHFPREDYDAFFHLGWHGVNREEINNEKVHEKSFENAQKCLAISKEIGCKSFLDIGSRAEYGVVNGRYVESKECHPLTAYAKEKLRFYQFAYDYTNQGKQNYLHYRIFSVIGVGDHPWSLISTACKCLKSGERMNMGACNQLWNFMDVRDAVEAMLMAYDSISRIALNDDRILNIAGQDTRILRSFIEEIRVITKSDSELFFDPNRENESVIPDTSKLERLTKWKAKYTFADTIKDILNTNI